MIFGIALLILFLLSVFSWEKVSGGFFKSYDMFGDLRAEKSGGVTTQSDYLDPDLALLDDSNHYVYIDGNEYNEADENGTDEDDNVEEIDMHGQFPDENIPVEETARYNGEVSETANIEPTGHENLSVTPNAVADRRNVSPQKTNVQHKAVDANVAKPDPVSRKVTTLVTAEKKEGERFTDYSPGKSNLRKLRKALGSASNRLVRWAVIGDSYIEGDIFTQNIREALQENYGGRGAGYLPAFSEIPGFRRSVVQSCTDFELLDFRKKSQNPYCMLQGVAAKAMEGASTTFNGTNKISHAGAWNKSRILFKTPGGGSLKVRVGTDKNVPWKTFRYQPSDSLHCIEIDEETSRLSIASVTPGIIIQGVYLDDNNGVAVDNMSIRGYAGIRHDEINNDLIKESRREIDYDVIMLEFGINALSASQTNYDAYGKKMIEVVESIKRLYPEAVIIIMGIGDRGEKRGGEIHSMTTVDAMTAVQRSVAATTGSVFWDTREAMGGEDAVVDWVKQGDINKDYIHLSFNGGKRLSQLFIEDLEEALK